MKGFYWYFRPIAICFKILGIFPLNNISTLDTSKLTFQIRSSSHFYSFFILSSLCIMIYLFYGFVVSLKSFAEIIKLYVIWGMIVKSLACFVLYGLTSFPELPLLIQLIDSFDRMKKSVILEDTWGFFTKFLVWTIVPAIVIIAISMATLILSSFLIHSILPERMINASYGTLFSYIFAYLMSRDLYSSLLYIYFASVINNGYRNINSTLVAKNIVPSYYRDISYPSDLYSTLSQIRLLHNLLSKCVSQLGKAFGTFIALDEFVVILVLVINITVYLNLREYFLHLLMLTLVNAVLVVWSIGVSHEIKKNAAMIIDLLHGIPSTAIDENSLSEIVLIHQQYASKPIEVSAGGHCILDRHQLVGVVGAVAHYMVASMQLLEDTEPNQTHINNSTGLF